jgi:CSLREA domain-containing protein
MKTGRLITPIVLSVAAFAALWMLLHYQPVEAVDVEGATIIDVDTTADDNTVNGNCTLREAVIAFNTGSAVDLCNAGGPFTFINVPSGTITLTVPGIDEDAGAAGDIDIDRKATLAIVGDSVEGTTIDGGGLDRVFHVVFSDVTFHSLTIQNGTAVSDSVAAGSGGGIAISEGYVFITNTQVAGNSAANQGGGVWLGIFSGLEVYQSTIDNNSAAAGGGVYSADSSNGIFFGNSTGWWGLARRTPRPCRSVTPRSRKRRLHWRNRWAVRTWLRWT